MLDLVPALAALIVVEGARMLAPIVAAVWAVTEVRMPPPPVSFHVTEPRAGSHKGQ